MFDLKSRKRKTDDAEIENFNLERDKKISAKVIHYVKKSEGNYNQRQKLNQKNINLTTSNRLTAEQQQNHEAQKAVKFKAKALFELEQVITEIEQLKQISK